jgi:hypothetical protein
VVNAEREPTVMLRSSPGDHLVRYTGALQQLSDISIGRHALIGGFAVMVRLATAHRVTEDLDAVTWTEDGTPEAPIALLVEHGATRSRNGVDLGDVHIDLIAVSDYEPAQLPDDIDDAMFVITHAYGLASATWLMIEARDANDDRATRATARVATPAALVAMKLRAMQQRRANVLNKRASDAYDAYRLLAAHDRGGSIARELATAPDGLGAWCVTRARDAFDTNAGQTRRWLATGSPDMASVSVDDLRTVGTIFADVLDELLRR